MYKKNCRRIASYTLYQFFEFNFPIIFLMRSLFVTCARQSAAAAAMLALLAVATAGCTRTEKAQARGREDAAKPVKVETIRQEAIRRAVEVVGTLAAVDEVTISSEAEGRVSKLHADLGDRVTAGQALLELDNEKPRYTFDQQKAALDSTLARFGATDTAHLPSIEKTPDVMKAQAELGQA
ncbi:MAG: biotin/lipoyl-binding protein, partial [Acidobacteria bacterium]|nr:biotin/lipoyl-binding protein [Acidobacteriota bacterium]